MSGKPNLKPARRSRPMALDFPSLGALIRWLADTHHDGNVLPMASRVGISPAAMHKWRHDVVKNPLVASLYALADAYSLKRNEVLDVVVVGRTSGRQGQGSQGRQGSRSR